MNEQKKTYFEELMYINLYSYIKDDITGKEFYILDKDYFERYGFRVEPQFAVKMLEQQQVPIKKILDLGVLRIYRISFVSNHDDFHVRDILLLIYEDSIMARHKDTPRKWLIGGASVSNEFKDERYASYVLKRIFEVLSETLSKNGILVRFEWDRDKQILYFGFIIEQQKYKEMFEELKSKGVNDEKDSPGRIKLLHGWALGDMAFIWLAIDELEFGKLIDQAFHKM